MEGTSCSGLIGEEGQAIVHSVFVSATEKEVGR